MTAHAHPPSASSRRVKLTVEDPSDTTEEFPKAVPDSLASTFRVHGLDSNPATSIFEAED